MRICGCAEGLSGLSRVRLTRCTISNGTENNGTVPLPTVCVVSLLQVPFLSLDLQFSLCKVGTGSGPNGFFGAGQSRPRRCDLSSGGEALPEASGSSPRCAVSQDEPS